MRRIKMALRGIGGHWRAALALALVPALTVAALAALSHGWALAAIIALQSALLLGLAGARRQGTPDDTPGTAPRCSSRAAVEATLDAVTDSRRTAALVVQLDDAARIDTLYGSAFADALIHALAGRLADTLREQDGFCRLPDQGFGIALFPQHRLDVGQVLSVAQRIQARLAQPFAQDGHTVWPSVSVGFCLSRRAAALNGLSMLEAAERAAIRAGQAGPGGLNSYSVVDFPAALSGDRIDDLRQALETGQIRAFFQPQIRTTTGEVTGLEALARWHHPQRGLIPPGEFLPQIVAAGLSPLLAERMLADALDTLTQLDRDGQTVPSVSVNLSAEDLRNPRLPDEIAWALDRADIDPGRLTVEILETVVAATDDDAAVHSIARLAGMGCGIDLDDFGTGHASITTIRRFGVGRLKIDRSFVTALHEDETQRRTVAAILSMADHLGLDTLAEGVECAGEQVALAQMGCGHLQGFAIARPMPADDLSGWLRAHDEALSHGEPRCEDPAAARAAWGGPG